MILLFPVVRLVIFLCFISGKMAELPFGENPYADSTMVEKALVPQNQAIPSVGPAKVIPPAHKDKDKQNNRKIHRVIDLEMVDAVKN